MVAFNSCCCSKTSSSGETMPKTVVLHSRLHTGFQNFTSELQIRYVLMIHPPSCNEFLMRCADFRSPSPKQKKCLEFQKQHKPSRSKNNQHPSSPVFAWLVAVLCSPMYAYFYWRYCNGESHTSSLARRSVTEFILSHIPLEENV